METRIHTSGGLVETFFQDSPALVARILKGIQSTACQSECNFSHVQVIDRREDGACVYGTGFEWGICDNFRALARALPKESRMKRRAAQNGTTTHKHFFNVVSWADFQSEVLRSNGMTLVMFWAPWSHPCQRMNSVLVEVARACGRRVKLVKVNADDNPDLSLCYAVQSIPTLLLFIAGKLSRRIVGTVSKKVILELFRGGRDAAIGVRPCENGNDA